MKHGIFQHKHFILSKTHADHLVIFAVQYRGID